MDCKHGNEIRQNNSCLKCSDEAVENILEIATSMADGSCFDHNDDICRHGILLTYANCKECDRELDERTEIEIKSMKNENDPADTNTTIKILIGDKAVGRAEALILEAEHLRFLISRLCFSRPQIEEAFPEKLVHAKSQKAPLQLKREADGMWIQNAWLVSSEPSYITDKWVIVQSAIFEAERYHAPQIISKMSECQWCGFTKNGFEEEHVSCQKAYRRGQQWAIDTLTSTDYCACDVWLASQMKDKTL